jgi:sugar lactone lactonase YvrE
MNQHEGGQWIGDPTAFHSEGAYWDGSRLLYVDLLQGDILTHDEHGDHRISVSDIAALVRPRTAGGYVAATERGFALLDDEFAIQRDIPVFDDAGLRMNEGACDAQGRLYCGSMAYDYRRDAGTLYRLDTDLSVHVVLDHVTIPNGLVWVAGGTIALHAETADDCIYAYEFDAAAGTFGQRAVFVDLADVPGSPDGIALDADGGLWVAMFGGSAVRRFDERGTPTDVVPLDVSNPTSCAIGGANGTTLFVTTSRQDAPDEERAGQVYAIDVGVRAAEVHAFGA